MFHAEKECTDVIKLQAIMHKWSHHKESAVDVLNEKKLKFYDELKKKSIIEVRLVDKVLCLRLSAIVFVYLLNFFSFLLNILFTLE